MLRTPMPRHWCASRQFRSTHKRRWLSLEFSCESPENVSSTHLQPEFALAFVLAIDVRSGVVIPKASGTNASIASCAVLCGAPRIAPDNTRNLHSAGR